LQGTWTIEFVEKVMDAMERRKTSLRKANKHWHIEEN
jgi:hypothetical protein